jgi:hypothetical protein
MPLSPAETADPVELQFTGVEAEQLGQCID